MLWGHVARLKIAKMSLQKTNKSQMLVQLQTVRTTVTDKMLMKLEEGLGWFKYFYLKVIISVLLGFSLFLSLQTRISRLYLNHFHQVIALNSLNN